MDIEIKESSKFKARIYGRDLLLSKPTVGQLETMQREMGSDTSKGISVTKKFLGGLGLPEDVADRMEPEHLLQLVEALCGSKKN